MKVLGQLPQRLPLGISDFTRLRTEGYTYVDKTAFIARVLDGDGTITLFPRPRRFGKSLNMSALGAFLERGGEDRTALFDDTYVWGVDGGRLRAHFQRYPVIFLTFKDIKRRTWEDTWAMLRERLQDEVARLWSAYELGGDAEPARLQRHARMVAPDAAPNDLVTMLPQLTGWLAHRTGEPVVVLIDEYDAPLHAAWEHGYWDAAIDFFRSFLASGLKDEAKVFRGVLTGILKVAKENIFSGLNNVVTSSLFEPRDAIHFGFTEDEVAALAERAGQGEALDGLREWYDGYRFGGTRPVTLYNPWSILQFLAKPESGFQSFWKNTSSNALVHELLLAQAAEVGPDIATLLDGGTVERRIDESVPLQLLRDTPEALWSLLTFSGYLTPEETAPADGAFSVKLRIPNREVAAIFRDTFQRFMSRSGAGPSAVPALVRALLSGDGRTLERLLGGLIVSAMSYHDFGRRPVEAVYQAFIVGLLVQLDATHRVVSNREAGYGRADVLVMPRRPGPGAVLELKTLDPEYGDTVASVLDGAVAQLEDRDYAAEVRAAGATEVHQYAVVFDGKRAWLRAVEAG